MAALFPPSSPDQINPQNRRSTLTPREREAAKSSHSPTLQSLNERERERGLVLISEGKVFYTVILFIVDHFSDIHSTILQRCFLLPFILLDKKTEHHQSTTIFDSEDKILF